MKSVNSVNHSGSVTGKLLFSECSNSEVKGRGLGVVVDE